MRGVGVAHPFVADHERGRGNGRRALLRDHGVRRPATRLVDREAVGGVLGVDTLPVG